MKLSLTEGGRKALWMGGGAFIGLAVGALFVGRFEDIAGFWVVGLAIFLGVVIGVARTREPRAAKPAKAAAATPAPGRTPAARAPTPASSDALHVSFDLPDVPAGYPSVMGRGEPLQVRVTVTQRGQPAEGAAVQLSAAMGDGSLTGDGVTGTDGAVEFTLEPEGAGELHLAAEARAGPASGAGSLVVSIVDYADEIERLFGEFRAYAVGVLGPEAHADTARELCDKLRLRSDPQAARALLELARVYELVAYGERTADRRLYLAVLEQLLHLEHAELPDSHLAREA